MEKQNKEEKVQKEDEEKIEKDKKGKKKIKIIREFVKEEFKEIKKEDKDLEESWESEESEKAEEEAGNFGEEFSAPIRRNFTPRQQRTEDIEERTANSNVAAVTETGGKTEVYETGYDDKYSNESYSAREIKPFKIGSGIGIGGEEINRREEIQRRKQETTWETPQQRETGDEKITSKLEDLKLKPVKRRRMMD